MSGDKLYIKPVGGLCNRLRAIGSATLIAEQSNKKLVVFWGKDIHLNCNFSDLFVPSSYFDVYEEKQWIGKKAMFPYLPGSKPTSLIRKALNSLTLKILDIRHQIWFEDFDKVVTPPEKSINPTIIKSMKSFEQNSYHTINKLITPLQNPGSAFICTAWKLAPWQNYKALFVPTSDLNTKIRTLSQGFDHTIGVHIRRGDHSTAIAFSQLDAFIDTMQRELSKNPQTDFYLATDCSQTEQQLKVLFGKRIRTFTKSSYDRNSTIGIQEGLIDLYVLSRTKKIFGSYYSSFSQVAAEISGIEEITVI